MRSYFKSLFLFAAVMALGCSSAMVPSPDRRGPSKVPVTARIAATVAESSAAPAAAPTAVEPPPVVEAPAPVMAPGSEDREKAVAWMLGFMTRQAPPGRTTFYTEAIETKEEALVRYRGIADAIIDVVYDPNTKPLFKGSRGRARTATIVLAIMLYESGFMKNVDYGVGKYGVGDSGNSWCLVQLNVGATGGRTIKWNTKYDRSPQFGDDPADIFQGNTGKELVADRHVCVREGLKAMRVSFTACAANPMEERLNVYASGNCQEGAEGSRLRMKAATKFWDESKAERTFTDASIVDFVTFQHGQSKPVETPPAPVVKPTTPPNPAPAPAPQNVEKPAVTADAQPIAQTEH